MDYIKVLSEQEKIELFDVLSSVTANPYLNYLSFEHQINNLIEQEKIPYFFKEACQNIIEERAKGQAAHVLKNCPIDLDFKLTDHNDPYQQKLNNKNTFIGESLLSVFSKLLDNPLLSYNNRFDGSFFADVFSWNQFNGHDSQFGDTELALHNDRTAHDVRADFTTLLGINCPEKELIFTSFIDGRDILKHLTSEEEEILRQPFFYTEFDVHSKQTTKNLVQSKQHPLIEESHCICYRDGWTSVGKTNDPIVKDAFIAFIRALSRAEKQYHRLLKGDLFVFANQQGLHARTHMEINNPLEAKKRWLLKTYSFESMQTAKKFSNRYVIDKFGCVND